ncbi:unnamed protein product, partial [Rotaria sp. Silwood1]
FSIQQTISIYNNWWLAAWSDDENRRHHQNLTNCMVTQDKKIDTIYQMNDIEWYTHRDRRFYIFYGWFVNEILVAFSIFLY